MRISNFAQFLAIDHMMTRIIAFVVISIFSISSFAPHVCAGAIPDEKDYDPSIRLPVRRLHPERPNERRDKIRKAEEKRRQKAERELRERELDAARLPQDVFAGERALLEEKNKDYLDSLLSINYTIPKLDYGPSHLKWNDEPVAESKEELLSFFSRNSDCYVPKDVSMDKVDNGIFFYFNVKDSKPSPLRLRAQYCADDPLNIEKVQFIIDGYSYMFTPSGVEAGQGGSNLYWENFDNPLSKSDKDLAYALSHCSWARVMYMGAEGINHVKKISERQIKDFYYALQLYRKMGGSF